MVTVPRRALGAVLVVVAGLLFTQSFLLRSTAAIGDGLPTIMDPGSLADPLGPALVAAGAITLVSGVAAIRGRALAPRWSLVAPPLSAVAGVALDVNTSAVAASNPTVAVSEPTSFVVAGAVIGASLAPVTLGATKGDTVTLLVGVVLLLVGTFAAPAPAIALVAGIAGGGVAVGLLWTLDAETWQP